MKLPWDISLGGVVLWYPQMVNNNTTHVVNISKSLHCHKVREVTFEKNPLVDIEREKWRDTLRRMSDVVMIETCQLCITGSLKHTHGVNHRMCERVHSGSMILREQ